MESYINSYNKKSNLILLLKILKISNYDLFLNDNKIKLNININNNDYIINIFYEDDYKPSYILLESINNSNDENQRNNCGRKPPGQVRRI